jgi:hypothetical protein
MMAASIESIVAGRLKAGIVGRRKSVFCKAEAPTTLYRTRPEPSANFQFILPNFFERTRNAEHQLQTTNAVRQTASATLFSRGKSENHKSAKRKVAGGRMMLGRDDGTA